MKLEIYTRLQIARSASEIFEAIVDPDQMKNYFISRGSGRMEEGKTLEWQFPEFDASFSIRVGEVIPNRSVSFYWEIDNSELMVLIELSDAAGGSTIVSVREGPRENNEAGIKWLKSNTEGWANFLACLKAYLEYGINLRKGGFDFLRNAAAD